MFCYIGRQTVTISWAGPAIADDELSNGESSESDIDGENGSEATSRIINDEDEYVDDDDDDDDDDGDNDDDDDDDIRIEPNRENEEFRIDVEPIETVDVIQPPQEQVHDLPSVCTGFKIVGDNLDKNIRPSFQRCDRQTISLHYFHSCAISDRIDFSSLSNIRPKHIMIDPAMLLPNRADLDCIKQEFQVLVSR